MTDKPTDTRELHWRVKDLERRVEERLRAGTETMSRLKSSLDAVHKEAMESIEALRPRPTPWWKIASIAVGVASVIGALIWQAARYPDRQEFEAGQERQSDNLDRVRGHVNEIKLEQVQIRGDVDAIRSSQARVEKSQEAISERLDEALRRRGR